MNMDELIKMLGEYVIRIRILEKELFELKQKYESKPAPIPNDITPPSP